MMGGENVIAVGNGRNDVPMMDRAGLRIAVIGPEGVSAELVRVPKVVNPTKVGVTGFYTFCKAGNLDIHIIAC